ISGKVDLGSGRISTTQLANGGPFWGRRFLPLGSPASAGLFRRPALAEVSAIFRRLLEHRTLFPVVGAQQPPPKNKHAQGEWRRRAPGAHAVPRLFVCPAVCCGAPAPQFSAVSSSVFWRRPGDGQAGSRDAPMKVWLDGAFHTSTGARRPPYKHIQQPMG